MFIDWDGNGKIDPTDIALYLAMAESGEFDEDEEDTDDRDDLEEYQDSRR